MALPEDKYRIAITLGKDLLARLDAYCDRTGMTRSNYICFAVAQQLDAQERVTNTTLDAIKQIFEGVMLDEDKLAALMAE